MYHHKIVSPALLIFAGFGIGIAIAYSSFHIHKHSDRDHVNRSTITNIRQTNTAFTFIKPLLNSEYASKEESAQRYPYIDNIQTSVSTYLSQHRTINTGVYYLDLTNSAWTGINETDRFVPASLLKVPMIISYYKLRESEPGLFTNKINFAGPDYNSVKNLGAPGNIKPGQTYSVEELLREMIINSDNNALELLYTYRKDALSTIFKDLDAPLPDNQKDIALTDYLSPKEDSKFFLVLYNASYLDRRSSEEVLRILSETNFKDGIVAGTPLNTLVSHKFGERIIEEDGVPTGEEFHDCGIVYYPGKPYFLCVMTKGNNLEEQQKVARDISKEVFEIVSTMTVGMR